MKYSFDKYIENVKEQLECNATDEYKSKYIVYTYSNEQVDSNLEYFKKCKDDNLSPYKSLLFFYDYLNRELCECGKFAIWCYFPGYLDNSNPYFCDDCVPRGCTCNHRYVDVNAYESSLEQPDLPAIEDEPIKWIQNEKVWCHVDEKGREFPCCEYGYNENGWSKDD
jgi:hypothetical protein